MCGGNADAVRAALDAVLESLGTARKALDEPDPIGSLVPWLAPGAKARSAWPRAASEPAELPASPDVLLRLGRAGGWVIRPGPTFRHASQPESGPMKRYPIVFSFSTLPRATGCRHMRSFIAGAKTTGQAAAQI